MSIASATVNLSPAYRTWASEGLTLELNTEAGLGKVVDSRRWQTRVFHIAFAVLFTLTTLLIRVYRLFFSKLTYTSPSLGINKTYIYSTEHLPWTNSQKSEGLYLFIHGLYGSPLVWERHANGIKSLAPNTHIFTPRVPMKGNCSLEIAATPFRKAIKNYLTKFPYSPVTIIGTSNGARIALYVETRINPDLLRHTQLRIISLAGVHYGTYLVNLIKKFGLMTLSRLDMKLADEFMYESDAAKSNLFAWHMRQRLWNERKMDVKHFFCAASEDEQVISASSALPYHKLSNITFCLLAGHSHISIVDGALPKVRKWLNNL